MCRGILIYGSKKPFKGRENGLIWVKNYNWEDWVDPENNTYKPSKAILELRIRATKLKGDKEVK